MGDDINWRGRKGVETEDHVEAVPGEAMPKDGVVGEDESVEEGICYYVCRVEVKGKGRHGGTLDTI